MLLFAVLKCLNGNCWLWIIVIDIFFLISLILKFMIWYIDFEVLWCVNDVFLFDQQVNQSKGSHYDSMSDSETDDAWRAVLLSRTKLNEVKQRLRNLEEDDQFTKNPVELVNIFFHNFFNNLKKNSDILKKNLYWKLCK